MLAIIRFTDKEALHTTTVGQKFATLAQARREGFPVPTAVAIPTEIHHYFKTRRTWPQGAFEPITAAAQELGLFETGLSVRSSATLEDLADRSFAGQYCSFLQVKKINTLRTNIEKCWQSIDRQAVQSYLTDRPTDGEQPAMGVILQTMVAAKASGVAFGRDPMNPGSPDVIVEAIAGLAEDLVSGAVSPYRAAIDPQGRVQIKAKPNPPRPAKQNGLLADDQWRAIASLVRRLEACYDGTPLDIEWAIDSDNKLWLLQARRITTLDTQPRIPQGIWTRKIADDLWGDRLTPFMQHALIKNAPHYDMSRMCMQLGMVTGMPNLTVINGYLYVNSLNLRHLLTFVPPALRTTEYRDLLPPQIDFDRIPTPSLSKLIRLAGRALLLAMREPNAIPVICLRRYAGFRRRMARRLDTLGRETATDARQAFDKVQKALRLMAETQNYNQFPYYYATQTTWLARWLVVDLQQQPHSRFLALLSCQGRNVTITIERKVRALAALIRRNPQLKAQFENQSAEELARDIPAAIRPQMTRFLAQYGCRSRHRTLYLKRWAEAPEEVLRMLQSLALGGNRPSLNVSGEPDATDTPGPKRNLPGLLACLAQKPVLILTRRFLDLREEARFLLDKALYQIRRWLLRTGDYSGLGDHILFLTTPEIEQLLDGQLGLEDARRRTDARYRQYQAGSEPAPFYVDGQPYCEIEKDPHTLRGIGTSPGHISGRARIVKDPFVDSIEDGDILIAQHTDPGWTPILSRISGMVIEEGGLLNHCSIVARELGVPAVVGIPAATRRIPDGTRITIDGGLGYVRLS